MNYLDSSAPGGISKVVSELEKGLTGLGHRVRAIQPENPREPTTGEYYGFRESGAFRRVGFHHLHLGDISSISVQVRRFKPEIINIHGSRTFLSPWAVWRLKQIFPDIPLIFSPHHDSQSGETFSGKYFFWAHKASLLRAAYRSADAITVCSEFERREVSSCFSGGENKIFTIPNGIDEVRASETPIVEREKRIISAGYLFELKGVNHTIGALKELHERGESEWKLTVCGEGPHMKKLQKISTNLGISEHVEWKGFVSREELISLINSSRVATLVSRSENFGIFAAECLSLGVPTIVTDVTALSEFGWIDWCYKIPYPVDSSVLADCIVQASSSKTTAIVNQGNIQSWNNVAANMSRILEKVAGLGAAN